MKPGNLEETGNCRRVSAILSRIGDKWSVLVVRELSHGSRRFSELRRALGSISQKMLTTTLRNLERDGFVKRSVFPTIPPRVDYELTALGRDLGEPIEALASWAMKNADRIESAQRKYDGTADEARGGFEQRAQTENRV